MKPINRKDEEQEVNGVAPENDGLLVQKRIALRAYELYLQEKRGSGLAITHRLHYNPSAWPVRCALNSPGRSTTSPVAATPDRTSSRMIKIARVS